MAECEICGEDASGKAKIDGVILSVCDKCTELGEKVILPVKTNKIIPKKDIEDGKYIDPKYPELIKKAREKRKLRIDELARHLNEKESVISRLERGHFSPSFKLAKKLEKFFEIELILEYEDVPYSHEEKHSGLTIGDVIDLGELDD